MYVIVTVGRLESAGLHRATVTPGAADGQAALRKAAVYEA